MSGDLYTYESSMASQLSDESFKNKVYSYVQDLNNSNNPTQLKFNLDGFRSSDKFVNPSEMFLEIPIILAISRDSASAGLASGLGNLDFATLLKSGYWNLIQSMSVMIDNKECVQITPNLNYFVNYKISTSYSSEDLNVFYGILGYYPDSSTSWNYSPVGTPTLNGEGIYNNRLSPVFTASQLAQASTQYGDTNNTGALQRTFNNNVRVTGGSSKWASIKTLSQFQTEGKNYIASSDATVGSAYRAQYITAIIRLKDLSHLFEQLPIMRGFNCVLTMNLNLGNVKVTKTGNATATSQTMSLGGTTSAIASSVQASNGGSIPFMVSALSSDWGSTTQTESGDLAVGCYYASVRASGVGNQSALNIPAHSLTTARVYAPLIELQPERGIAYLSENKKKLVVYKDLLYFSFTNVASGTTFNFQLAPSINNVKSLVVIPNLGSNVLGIIQGQSPFDTCPSTTAPLSIANFNVQVASQNILQQNVQYGFEQFMFETLGANSLNGSLMTGLNSSLVGFTQWDNIYKYYYVNLARRLPSDNLGKSVSIIGQNNNSLSMDLFVFVEIEKSMIIDVESGKVEELRV